MKPTGKNKEQFKKYYDTIEGGNYKILYQNFMAYPFEMQIGVYLAYYDSTKFKITINYNSVVDWYFKIKENKILKSSVGNFKTRKEAYKEALKQLNELINKSLKE